MDRTASDGVGHERRWERSVLSESGLLQSRGGIQREAILSATRELLETQNFEDISVTAITGRAGIARSGFYFYFDSKHSVLATMMQDLATQIDELTDHFAARDANESSKAFVARMIRGVVTLTVRNQALMAACHRARYTDDQVNTVINALSDSVIAAIERVIADEVTAGTAEPIADDVPTLVRILAAVTQFVGSDDTAFVRAHDDRLSTLSVVEQLWLHAFWGNAVNGSSVT